MQNLKLHKTYNNIQYIMGKEQNISKFLPYQRLFVNRLKLLQQQHSQKFLDKQTQLKTMQLAQQINGQDIFFNTEEIAQAVTSKLGKFQFNANSTIDQQLANIYQQLQKDKVDGASIFSQLHNLIKIKSKMLPKGSSLTIERGRLKELETLLLQAKSFKTGHFYNTLGEIGEFTSTLAASSIANELLQNLESQLNLTHGSLKVKAKLIHTAKDRINNVQVQTDNKLELTFDINDQNLIGKINMPAGGVKMTLNLSDKAKKNLVNIDSKRRTSTGAITFRSTTMNQFLNDNAIDAKAKAAMYNLISFHRAGDNLVNFMYTAPGFALREYIGYKMAAQMFLDKEELNQVHFTVYGSKVFAESSVLDKLLKNKFIADIEYWSLKQLLTETFEGTTVEGRLKEGTARANEMIRNMKVMLRTSLKF